MELLLTQPLQIIVGNRLGAFGSYEEGRTLFDRATCPKHFLAVDGASHYDLFDRPEHVGQAAGRLADFYPNTLAPRSDGAESPPNRPSYKTAVTSAWPRAAGAASGNRRAAPSKEMTMLSPIITTFGWVPPFARGTTRDLRARWACEEEGIAYQIRLIDWDYAKSAEHRRFQPFGQIPTYSDGVVDIFETGAIALRIAEIGGKLLPSDPVGRMKAIQWLIASLNSIEPWIMRASVEQAAGDDEQDSRRGDGMTATGDGSAARDLHNRLADLQAALGDRQWLDGDRFTVGDLMMISVLGQLRNTDALNGLPVLAAYVARGEARPAHRKAVADQLALYDSAGEP